MSLDKAYFLALAEQHGTPLLVLDCAEIERRYAALVQALPGVQLHYAIKALPHADVIATLNQLGAGFDVATSGELDRLKAHRIDPRRCLHTHPIKTAREIKTALRFGCTSFVVDNAIELEKFAPFRHRVSLLLRVSYRNPSAVVDLSRKFGCALEQAPALLGKARQLGLHVRGLSFHVGSQCLDARIHADALRACLQLSESAEAAGTRIRVIDIGGGFPVSYDREVAEIREWCAPIRDVLRELPSGIEVVAEPGRYLVAAAVTGVFSVIGKALREDRPWYYLDDGVYGSFSGQLFDHARYPIQSAQSSGPQAISTLAGPTCDSIDVIAESISLPGLSVGDMLIGRMMGAYSAASTTEFNSIAPTPIVAINRPPSAATTESIRSIA